MTGTERSGLRPVERRALRMADAGMDATEIADRLRRSPGHVDRLLELARLPDRDGAPRPGHAGALRPIERRLLHWRSRGVDYGELAPRFRRSPAHLARVEALARYKLAAAAHGEDA